MPTSQQPLLSDDDKAVVREEIIKVLLGEPEKSMRSLLSETLHTVVVHDFPTKWPQLIPSLLQTIQTGVANMEQNALRVHNALLALRKVCKRFEYKPSDQREPLNEIVRASFPLLLPLGQQLSEENQHSLEAAMMLKQILKIFWSSTQFFLPTSSGPGDNTLVSLSHPEQLQPWFQILSKALAKKLPENNTSLEPRGQPTSIEERNAWPWWKVKKWAVQIMSRWFSRYGVPSHTDSEKEPAAHHFALHFSQHVAPQFMGPVFDTLNLRPTGQFCTDRVVHLCLTYVQLAVDLSSTYKMIKPHLDFILFQVCFPTMCFSPEDVECFENDPIEFINKQNSPLADFYDPRMSAITLVTDMVRYRGQDVTQPLLSRMTNILHQYREAPDDQKNHIEKDGALLTFGSLAKQLLAKEKYASEIEGLLVISVFPDFNSPIAFLRYRACWMVQEFNTVKWSDDGSNLRSLLEMVLQRLQDPALPVQIEASKALRYLVETDGADHVLLPVLPQILTEYFRIMKEIGNDEVVSALQVLLDQFGDHLEPHAQALVTQLTDSFYQYCSAGDDEDDDGAALAAAQCLECMSTVLKGVCASEHILKTLEPQLMPLVLKILGNDGDFLEYLESALDILTFLTYFQSQLSQQVWQAFPLVYLAFDQWAYDYLNMMVPCLLSYINKGPDVFLMGKATIPEGTVPFMDLIVSMASKTLSNDSATEAECRYALSLFMGVLHNCPGKIDAYLPFINKIVLGKLGQQVQLDTPLTRISIFQVIGSAFYYNPLLELQELEKQGVTQQVIATWVSDTEHMDRPLPRKMTVLGMGSLLKLPTPSIPPSIVSCLPQLIHTAVMTVLLLKSDSGGGMDNDDHDLNGNGRGFLDDDELGDVDEGYGEDEDVRNGADEAYRQAVQRTGEWNDDAMNKFLLGDLFDEGEDVDEEYTSPLDSVDELLFLNDTIKEAFLREPEVYQQIQAALRPDSVAACQNVFAAADGIRAMASQQQQQQQQQG